MEQRKLTADNYYSPEQNSRFFSVSQYKDFMKCEAAAMAKIRGCLLYTSNKCNCVTNICIGTTITLL